MYPPALSEIVLPARFPLAAGLNPAIVIVVVPDREVGGGQLGLHRLTPVTFAEITPVEVFKVPPTSVKSILLAKAAVGSANASRANNATRLIYCSSGSVRTARGNPVLWEILLAPA